MRLSCSCLGSRSRAGGLSRRCCQSYCLYPSLKAWKLDPKALLSMIPKKRKGLHQPSLGLASVDEVPGFVPPHDSWLLFGAAFGFFCLFSFQS